MCYDDPPFGQKEEQGKHWNLDHPIYKKYRPAVMSCIADNCPGTLCLDIDSAPKWQIDCNICLQQLSIFEDKAHKVKVTQDSCWPAHFLHRSLISMMGVMSGAQHVSLSSLLVGETLRVAARSRLGLVSARKLDMPEQSASTCEQPASEPTPELELAGVRPPPGLPPPAGLPSHGSCLHGTGRCRPCMWFFKASGCAHGEECLHCHLCPQSEIAARRKRRRARLGADAKFCAKDAESKVAPCIQSDEDTSLGSSSDTESLTSVSS